MSSGDPAGEFGHPGQATIDGRGGGAQADDGGSAPAMDETSGASAAATFGGARARALAAMQATAAVRHGRLAAGAAGPGLRPATRRRQIVARRIAVLEPAAAQRQGGGRGRAN